MKARESGESGAKAAARRGLPLARLATFGGLATLAAVHWASLVVEPPVGGLVVVVAASVLAATAMAALGRRLPRGRPRAAGALGIAFASAAVGLVAVGLEPALVLPSGWEQLRSELEAGFTALSGDLDYPFAGSGGLARTLLLAGLPLLLALALVPAFWPGRGPGPRYDALALMIAAYAVPATVNPRGAQGWVGFALLLLIGAWLFAPRLRRPFAIGAVVLAGLACVPLATALEGEPWLDYRDWELGADSTSFQWEHSYGPIDWPRTGDTLFTVRSEEARYWRADVLEGFDGRGWIRAGGAGAGELLGLGPAGVAGEPPARWIERAEFSIEGLTGAQVIAPGTALEVKGISASAIRRGDDGSLEVVGEPLGAGSSYEVDAYSPDPSADRMREGSDSYESALAQYTTLGLPGAPGASGASGDRVEIPVWGSQLSRELAEGRLAASPYSRMAALARRLTADAPTAYDATRTIEAHLRSNYTYSERPRDWPLPLDAFLFEDRIGYCQQFSGAMAAMLRMVGIPSRVATGFTPGRQDSDRDLFEVSDLDAHSWVEVYFNQIGWVPFDPTPSASPARSQDEGIAEQSAAGGDAGIPEAPEPIRDRGTALEPAGGGEGTGSGGGFPWSPAVAAIVIALMAPFALGIARTRRYRRLDSSERLERGVAEVERIAGLARIETRRSTTLWRLSDRLRRRRLRAGASYVAALAAGRYGSSGMAPTLAERRRVRAELAAGAGLLRRARLWWELPPGGPRGA